MASVLKSGTAITFPVTPLQGGFPESAFAISKAVTIGGAVVWQDETKQPWAEAVTQRVLFPAAASMITGVQEFALFNMQLWNEAGESVGVVSREVIIEVADLLRPLVNSFGTWGDLVLKGHNMVNLKAYEFAEDDARKAALIQAYHNIGEVNVSFCHPHRRARYNDQNRLWDDTGIFEDPVERIYSTRQLDVVSWNRLHSDIRSKLMTAQLIEANYLLSDQTPEKQRLAGLLSHSAGESAHFYRTVKPLELPVCRATAMALKGIISYVIRIAG